ncbi:MAG: NERD domain-containing protein [Gammaproteobacteria bacterium]|nr:NERD domain-containing protein [Gammaproteobacteria bacterium]
MLKTHQSIVFFSLFSLLSDFMNSDNFPIQEWITSQNLLILSALFVGVSIILLNRKSARILWLEWRTRRCLNQIGIKQRSNVLCCDGIDGEFILDRLVMLPNAILLINFKRYSGNIYCSDRIAEWTQVVEQKSFKFENPLFDLENQLTAIRTQIPDVSIKGYLFFDHTAQFPKGHPETVLHPDNIPSEYLRINCTEPKPAIVSAWESLIELPSNNGSNRPQRLKT